MTAVLIRRKEGNSLAVQWLRFSASTAGGMGLIPCWRTNLITWGFPDNSVGKESACNVGDLGSIPGLGRSSGEGKGYPHQYSDLENSMDYTAHGVAESNTTEQLLLSRGN